MDEANLKRTTKTKLYIRIGSQGGYNITAFPMLFEASEVVIVGTRQILYNATKGVYDYWNAIVEEDTPSGIETLTLIEYRGSSYLVIEPFNSVVEMVNACCKFPINVGDNLVITLRGDNVSCVSGITTYYLDIIFSNVNLLTSSTVVTLALTFIHDGIVSTIEFDSPISEASASGMSLNILSPTNNVQTVSVLLLIEDTNCTSFSTTVSVESVTNLVNDSVTYTSNTQTITQTI